MTRLDEVRAAVRCGEVERSDIDYLLEIAEAASVLLDELENESGYWDNEVKEKAFGNEEYAATREDDMSNQPYYDAIRRAIDLTGWQKRTWKERYESEARGS